MKKFFVSRWETVWYTVIMVGTVTTIFQMVFTGWPSYPLVMGLLISCIIYMCTILVLFIQQPKLRRVAHFVQCIFVAVFLALTYHGGDANEYRAAWIPPLLIYVVVGFTIARSSVWFYKRHQTKKSPSAPKSSTLPTDEAEPANNAPTPDGD